VGVFFLSPFVPGEESQMTQKNSAVVEGHGVAVVWRAGAFLSKHAEKN